MNPYRSMLVNVRGRLKRLDLAAWFSYSEHAWHALLVFSAALVVVLIMVAFSLYRYVAGGIPIPEYQRAVAPSVTRERVAALSDYLAARGAREAYLIAHPSRIVDPSR